MERFVGGGGGAAGPHFLLLFFFFAFFSHTQTNRDYWIIRYVLFE